MKTSAAVVSVNVRYPSEPPPPQLPVSALATNGTMKRPPGAETLVAPPQEAQDPQPSSTTLSQLSSTPLQSSVGGTQAPTVQSDPQVLVPVEPQEVVQLVTASGEQAKPSSMTVSQLSSTPLQISSGTVHAPHEQSAAHSRVPVEPHEVVQDPVLPAQHAMPGPSSQAVLQSSSTPLHTSAGGEQTFQPHAPLQVREPVVPQLVMHEPLSPAQQVKVSSHIMSQSSSVPLHASAGGAQVPQEQSLWHV